MDEMRRYLLENWFELAILVSVFIGAPLVLLWTAALLKIERHLRVIREELEIRAWPPREDEDKYLIPR